MTARREIRLERLMGRPLVDAHGYVVGCIEDVEAEPVGDDYVVTQVIVGPHGRLARLLSLGHQLPTLRAAGLGRRPRIRRVPWSWLDLSDPYHPRLLPTVVGTD
jgi:hypothetical protein